MPPLVFASFHTRPESLRVRKPAFERLLIPNYRHNYICRHCCAETHRCHRRKQGLSPSVADATQ